MKSKHETQFNNAASVPISAELARMKPAQMTVGMKQVEQKQKRLRELAKRPAELLDFILKRPIRVVLGPGKNFYVFDHNHLAYALLREKYETVPVKMDGDFSGLKIKEFWQKMVSLHLVHPYDAKGKLQPLSRMPKKLTDMEDDPCRSIAAFVREQGGFKKSQIPFAEFMWADYFRGCISEKLIAKSFNKAVKKALKLAHHPDARHLPGYRRT